MQRLFARTRLGPRAALASTRCKSSLGAAAAVRAPEEMTKEKEVKNLADAAGPGWWFLFHMMRTDPLSAQTYVYEHYGREHGAVRVRDYFGKQAVVIFDQDDVRHVYQHEGKNPKGTADMPPSIRYWRERGGDTEDNLALNINLTGDRWRKAREALGPGIYTEAVAKYEPFIQEAAREAVRSVKHYETDLSQWAPYASFDMFCALALGKSANTADPSCTSPMREVVDLEAQSIGLALRLTYTPKFSHPRLGYEQMRDGFDRILDIVRPEVHHLFSQEKMPDCWFKDLRDEQGVPIDQLEVVMGFLLSAAIGTTMSTIEWALVALAHFPREQAKVHAEILATLGGDQPYTKANKMPQLEAFLREVNRFFPPLSVSGIRKLEHEIVLPTSNVRVPAGATIFLAPLYQARDTHFISDADQFIPDRYLREKIRERKSCPFSSKLDASVVRNQFGNGSRVCLGKRAAELEVRALVCELLSHYEVVLDPPSQTLPGIAATTVGVPKPFPKLRLLPRKS